jgi:magnesium-dependent phosphatase 1
MEIYPNKNKKKHFSELKNKSKINFEEMVFFDDEYENIIDISKLGVSCKLIDNGMNKKDFFSTLISYEKSFLEKKKI